ncbi:MAG: hypothetical protein ACR2OX_13365, partial [Methyloligellaceae bacterium]
MGKRTLAALKQDPLTLALLLFGAYLMINATWAVQPIEAIGKVLLYFVAVIAVEIVRRWIALENAETIDILTQGILIGGILASAYVLIEIVSDQALKRWAYTTFPIIRPSSTKHYVISNGVVTQIGAYTLNRTVAVGVLLFWA